MVARTDLRPTRADDSLKKLLNKVANPQTTPHGVKVAQPGEYVDFYATDGVAHRWDGDTIAEYDTRIAEGAAAVAEAQAHLAEVEADLAEAKERITASNGDLTLYVERVEAAQAAADAANAALQNLTSELETTQSAVDAVTTRTGAVESAVVDTDAKATQAASAANAAANAAQNALAAAQQVQADAQNALTKAEEAEAKALEAAGIAAGKGKIIYSASEPSGVEASTSNLWVRSSDSKPHRWDGTQWVAITDKAIVDAAAAAAAAQGTASQAVADAAAAQSAADNAKAAADTAQAAAQTADAKAVNAASAASAAQTTADKAVSDASTAQAAANAADAKALAAAGLAEGKGKVLYATSAPTGADRVGQNLWVRLPDNVPHRWNGTQWVAVTDKTATDAAAAAANAQSAANTAKATADKAVQDAANAASTAQAASIAAGNAQRTADGKTVALFGTATPPPAPGVAKGDLYYRTGTDNRIIEQWQWSGSQWVKRAIESGQLVNFDAGYITSGFLDVTKRIQAGAIYADKLTVGIGDNLVPNGNGQAWEGWKDFEYSNTPANGASGYFKLKGKNAQTSARFNITPSIPMRCSCDIKSDNGTSNTYVETVFFNAQGATLTPRSFIASNVIPAKGAWTRYVAMITPPAGAVQAAIKVFAQDSLSTAVATDYQAFTNFSLRELKDGSLIVNGSITGEKVNAESVAAAVGSFVKVNAENVTVTNELAARVVSAMTAQVKNLVVTESAILQHTTLLGETVAERLNVTKKLVARDAIVNGTLDVEQLNITGDMAAQIVSAMSVASKKLIVTEDAILNRATVVQSLVTPELIADRINVNTLGAQLVTSGAIQTDPAANRGVKITNSGINAWDSNGVQTIRLNGADNLLMGSFQTAEDSIGRIRIFNQKDPVNHMQNGFITFHAIGGTKASHGVLAYTSNQLTLSVRSGNVDGTMQPFTAGLSVNPKGALLQGDLFLAGQFSKGGAIAAYTLSGGTIPAGGYVSFTQTVPQVNGQRPWSVVQPASSNFANLSAVTWTTDNKIEGRVYNNSNFAATGVWIDILTFGIER